MLVTVLYSTNGFFILVQGVFNFSFIFDYNCIFYEFILFPCQIITIMTRTINRRLCWKNAQRWKKAYLDMLIVFVEKCKLFGLRHSYLANFVGFFYFACLSLFSLLCAINTQAIDVRCLHKTYNSL